MSQFLMFVLGLALGFGVGWMVKNILDSRRSLPRTTIRGGNDKKGDGEGKQGLIEKQAREKAEHKQKILEIVAIRNITNDDAQKLLGVSDATATRYLDELEAEGRLRQVGKTGAAVYYEKIK